MNKFFKACGLAAAAFLLNAVPASAATSVSPATVDMFASPQAYNPAMGPAAAPIAPSADQATQAGAASLAPAATTTITRSLADLVATHAQSAVSDAEFECLAGAVYFEARGEPIEGQLAVAEVVLNRAASGKYPPSICAVVKQPAQFSFVRRGRFPPISRDCDAWRKAVAIARIAQDNLADKIAPNVLWYHANYVSPGWSKRLTRVVKIGAHIFYS